MFSTQTKTAQANLNSPISHTLRRLFGVAAVSAVVALSAIPATASAHGRWEHGWHGDHFGWWWVDAEIWTAYGAGYPWYPGYPYAYVPPYYAAPPAPADNTNTYLPPPPQVWYYCDAGQGYYPQVPSCPTGWRVVTVSQPQAAITPPPALPTAPPATAPAPAVPPSKPDASGVVVTPVK